MYRSQPAPDALSSYIECFWHWRLEEPDNQPQTLLPDATPELIVHRGKPPKSWSQGSGWKRQPREFMVCASNQALDLRIDHPMDVVGVRFLPWGLSRFSDRSMARMLDREVSVHEALGHLGGTLVAALRAADSDSDLGARLGPILESSLEVCPEKDEAIRTLMDALGGAGSPTITMAQNLARSSRTVNRIWRELVGIPPRSYEKLMRFHRALELIRQGRPLAWTAAECGYSDQAHMARQIRDIAGLPPSRLKTWLGTKTYADLYASRSDAPWKLEVRGSESSPR